LTEYGKKVYRNYYEEINTCNVLRNNGWLNAKLDKNGYWETQLWEFCQIFGKEMIIGNPKPPVCENLEIIIPYDFEIQEINYSPYKK
jgi:hypothetical protein